MLKRLELYNALSKSPLPRLTPTRFFVAALIPGKMVHIIFETA